MKIDVTPEYAKTQVESALAAVHRLRERLAHDALANLDKPADETPLLAEDLDSTVRSIAAAEARLAVAVTISDHLNSEGGSPETIRADLLSRVFSGPQDTWSGRGNDLKRTYFEAFLKAVQEATR